MYSLYYLPERSIKNMNETAKKVLFLTGAVIALYLFFVYILPFLFKLLGVVIGAFLSVVFWAAIALALIILIVSILRIVIGSNSRKL